MIGPPATSVSSTSNPRIVAVPTPFTKPVKYPDGIDLKILKVVEQTIDATGRGALTGKPQTTFTVEFANHSHQVVTLNKVVVSVVYGASHSGAAPVYGNQIQDFSGSVKPGHSAQTDYAFSIPLKSLPDVTMFVVFDKLHAAATFTGRVTIK